MKHTLRQIGLLVGALALAPLGAAQTNDMSQDYIRAAPGGKYAVQARKALRERRYADVERLCAQAMSYYEGTIFAVGVTIHEMLAESYLLQKRYGMALAEAALCRDEDFQQRFAVTRQLAMVGQGNVAKARADFVYRFGPAEDATGRIEIFAPLPMVSDDSVAAFVASLYMVRASFTEGSGWPEFDDDMKEAERLLPMNGSVLVYYARILKDAGRLEEALARYAKAATLGDPWAKARGKSGVEEVRGMIAYRAKHKP